LWSEINVRSGDQSSAIESRDHVPSANDMSTIGGNTDFIQRPIMGKYGDELVRKIDANRQRTLSILS
jgi:hypothetical protein